MPEASSMPADLDADKQERREDGGDEGVAEDAARVVIECHSVGPLPPCIPIQVKFSP